MKWGNINFFITINAIKMIENILLHILQQMIDAIIDAII